MDQVTKLIFTIENLHKPTLRALFEALRPDQHCLWELLDMPSLYQNLQDEYATLSCHICLILTKSRLTYEVLLTHCGASHIENPAARGILASSLVSKSSSLSDVERGAVLINHRLRVHLDEKEDSRAKDVLFLLAQAIGNAKSKFGSNDCKYLLVHVFDMDMVKRLCEQSLSADLRRGEVLSCLVC